jgi:uncharacterized protein
MRMCFRVSVLAGLLAFTAAAVDWKALKAQGYVSDFAHIIDPASRASLEAYAAAVERSTGAEMALVTIPSLNGEPVEDVANTIFRAWGVGKKGTNEGVLLLLSINDRRSRLEVGYGLEPILPDGFAGSVLRSMRPALRAGKYGDAMMSAAETIGNTVAASKHTTINTQLPPHMRQEPGGDFPWGALIAGGVILLLIFRARGPRGYGGGGGSGSGLLTGMILGNVLSRGSWGSRGSGGFGGSDSGDSFGGWGGGDSGGGGASSDW